MGAPSTPSQIRVFGKSMYVLAAGWIAAVAWLWLAGVQQHVSRNGAPPPNYALDMMGYGVVPAIVIALLGFAIARWTGRAPHPDLERREWWHAFWWSAVPNWLLFTTVWVMIQEGR
jgi:uncharacterized protein involved in response to NO